MVSLPSVFSVINFLSIATAFEEERLRSGEGQASGRSGSASEGSAVGIGVTVESLSAVIWDATLALSEYLGNG